MTKIEQIRSVPVTDECVEFDGYRNTKGYGYLYFDGKIVLAHRLSYQIHKGDIQDGLQVMHKCDNPPCINPKHLDSGTNYDNVMDSSRKGRRHTSRNNGEDNHASKVTVSMVEIIRGEIAAGAMQTVIAEKYGLSKAQVCRINKGDNWK